MNIFAELSRTNQAYCAAHGFTSAELYGTPINAAELDTHRNIAAGVPAESAGSFLDRVKADNLRIRKILAFQTRAARLRNAGYAPGRFVRFANRERWIRSQIGD